MTDNKKAAILAHIDKIEQYARKDGNGWLLTELERRFGGNNHCNTKGELSYISENVAFIRSALDIRAVNSISYKFINNQRLRDQLIIDNLRMENAALNLNEKEIDRFYTFCVNAFYQVENIVNYYFHIFYPENNKLLDVIEKYTKGEGENGQYQYCRSPNHSVNNVGDIPIFYKINAICNLLFPDDLELKIALGKLRKVRNEGEHRCQAIYSKKDETNKLYVFLKTETFNSIRILLIKVVSRIEHQMTKVENVEGVISSKLPSACFVNYNGKCQQMPPKLLTKVSLLNEGDRVTLKISSGKIIDVE